MSTFKGMVWWKDQCKYCKNMMFCKYREAVDLMLARLRVVELESSGCYGSLTFWCDYYCEDEQAISDMLKEHAEVLE